MEEFGYERLDVYKAAIQFLAEVVRLAETIPRGYASLGDQIRRAAMSIPLNIGEGSGKYGRDQTRYYVIARGSALECGAALDVIAVISPSLAAELHPARALLHRIVAMLTRLIHSKDSPVGER